VAFKAHDITKYGYAFDARSGGIGSLELWTTSARVLKVNFVDDGAAVPPPVLAADLNSATATFKRSALTGLIDMLRNERPITVTINNQSPGFVFIQTGLEPVGEGEA
jgi:hypothetical protein